MLIDDRCCCFRLATVVDAVVIVVVVNNDDGGDASDEASGAKTTNRTMTRRTGLFSISISCIIFDSGSLTYHVVKDSKVHVVNQRHSMNLPCIAAWQTKLNRTKLTGVLRCEKQSTRTTHYLGL